MKASSLTGLFRLICISQSVKICILHYRRNVLLSVVYLSYQTRQIQRQRLMTDELLLKGLREQSASAMRDFVTLYQQRVYNTAISFVKDSADAEELAQDVFLTVWHSADSFRGDASLSTWVYRITVSKSLDLIKSRSRKKRLGFIFSISGDNQEVASKTVNWVHPGVIEENKEKAAYLFRAIDSLPENQRVAFTLSKVEQLSQREIAEIMKLKEGAVESLLQRAKQNLRKALDEIYKELYE